ncbi:hypothetical protein LTR08_003563 [Meristemomyces frigidus]|nr:hypothetical protein LTR08_003563 [Meristemomyces frigidus]
MHTTSTTTLYASKTHKAFTFDTKLLKEKLPFLKKLLTETPEPLPEQTTFDDTPADEASMALLQHWVSGSKPLQGPADFHTIGHYLGLYALARKFQSEPLQNLVMDLMRAHYAAKDLTAPPYRIEYIHAYADGSPMQGFLLATAAHRCMQGKERPTVSDSMYSVLQNGSLMREFIEYLVHNNDVDTRHGSKCA